MYLVHNLTIKSLIYIFFNNLYAFKGYKIKHSYWLVLITFDKNKNKIFSYKHFKELNKILFNYLKNNTI